MGSDSPVSEDSSTCRLLLVSKRISAPTCTPAVSSMRSPQTNSLEGIVWRFPERRTVDVGEESSLSAASAFSALFSWKIETKTLMATISKTTIVLV